MTPELQKTLRLKGLDKRARGAFFNSKRKAKSQRPAERWTGNYERHTCAVCGRSAACEMDRCTHAVCVRVCSGCDSSSGWIV